MSIGHSSPKLVFADERAGEKIHILRRAISQSMSADRTGTGQCEAGTLDRIEQQLCRRCLQFLGRLRHS